MSAPNKSVMSHSESWRRARNVPGVSQKKSRIGTLVISDAVQLVFLMFPFGFWNRFSVEFRFEMALIWMDTRLLAGGTCGALFSRT